MFGPGEASIIDNATPLRRALGDKGGAYGSLGLPYVVAIRTSELLTDEFDILNVLYGTLKVQFGSGPNGEMATREVRSPDGYWLGATGWMHRNVSAVLVAHSLMPWGLASTVPTIWKHPDPAHPIDPPPMWRRAVIADGQLEYVQPSVLPHQILGLPEVWPEGDAFATYGST